MTVQPMRNDSLPSISTSTSTPSIDSPLRSRPRSPPSLPPLATQQPLPSSPIRVNVPLTHTSTCTRPAALESTDASISTRTHTHTHTSEEPTNRKKRSTSSMSSTNIVRTNQDQVYSCISKPLEPPSKKYSPGKYKPLPFRSVGGSSSGAFAMRRLPKFQVDLSARTPPRKSSRRSFRTSTGTSSSSALLMMSGGGGGGGERRRSFPLEALPIVEADTERKLAFGVKQEDYLLQTKLDLDSESNDHNQQTQTQRQRQRPALPNNNDEESNSTSQISLENATKMSTSSFLHEEEKADGLGLFSSTVTKTDGICTGTGKVEQQSEGFNADNTRSSTTPSTRTNYNVARDEKDDSSSSSRDEISESCTTQESLSISSHCHTGTPLPHNMGIAKSPFKQAIDLSCEEEEEEDTAPSKSIMERNNNKKSFLEPIDMTIPTSLLFGTRTGTCTNDMDGDVNGFNPTSTRNDDTMNRTTTTRTAAICVKIQEQSIMVEDSNRFPTGLEFGVDKTNLMEVDGPRPPSTKWEDGEAATQEMGPNSPLHKQQFEDSNDDDQGDNQDCASINSSGVVSSLTNGSTVSNISSITTYSSPIPTSPTLEHLDFLVARTTLASPPPNFQRNGKTKHPIQKERTAENIPLPISALNVLDSTYVAAMLKNTYKCKSNQEAFELAKAKASRFNRARHQMVDLLFEYLRQVARVSQEEISLLETYGDNHIDEQLYTKSSSETDCDKGITLPASAIGWLAIEMYPQNSVDIVFSNPNSTRNLREEDSLRKRIQVLKLLLPRHIRHLRISSKKWPIDPNESKGKKKGMAMNLEQRRMGRAHSSYKPTELEMQWAITFLAFYRNTQIQPRIDLRICPGISTLLADQVCPQWFSSLHLTCKTLKKLQITNGCIFNMHEIFSLQGISSQAKGLDKGTTMGSLPLTSIPRTDFIRSQFTSLTNLNLSRCGLGELSGMEGIILDRDSNHSKSKRAPPLSTMKALKFLDLSHNQLVLPSTALAGLKELPHLMVLNLSFNKLISMRSAYLKLGNVRALNLSNNRLTKVYGLGRLYSLEKLDISNNKIELLSDISGIAKLPNLTEIVTNGNPVAEVDPKRFRVKLLNFFKIMRSNGIDRKSSYRDLMRILPNLDGRNVSRKELVALKVLTFEYPVSPSVLPRSNSNNTTVSDPTELLLAPFRADDHSVNADGHIRVSRIVPRRTVAISDGFLHPRIHLNTNRGTINVRQRKTKKKKLHKKRNRSITLPCVIESIRPSPSVDNHEESSLHALSSIESKAECTFNDSIDPDNLVKETEDSSQKIHSKRNSEKKGEDSITDNINEERIGPYDTISYIENDDGIQLEGTSKDGKEESFSDLRVSASEETHIINNMIYNTTSPAPHQDEGSCTSTSTDKPNDTTNSVQHQDEGSCTSTSTNKPNDVSNSVHHLDEESYKSTSTYKSNDAANSVQHQDEESYKSTSTNKPNDVTNSVQHQDEESYKSTSTNKPNDAANSVQQQDEESYKSTSIGKPNGKEERDDKEGRSHNVIILSKGHVNSTNDVSGKDKLDFAAEERGSTYTGPSQYSNLKVGRYAELYFSVFVFPSLSSDDSMIISHDESINLLPRIQMYQTDRDLMMWMISKSRDETSMVTNHDSVLEKPKYICSEEILPCGIAATARILPRETDLRDFQGNVAYKEGHPIQMSDNQSLLLCISNAAVYFCPNFAAVGGKGKPSLSSRQFPSPIPAHAEFKDALWPHAYSRHPLRFLRKVSFDGFGFQRLTLHFKLPGLRDEVYMQPENGLMSAFEYTYVIFSCNQHGTIKMLQELQAAVKESSPDDSQELCVENDDSDVLKAISRALGPKNVCDNILHYQVLRQMWPHQNDSVRRALILTDDHLYLFDENYIGDGYSCTLNNDEIDEYKIGDVVLRTIASTLLADVIEIFAADKDPRLVVISIKAQARLFRPQVVWRLLCRDRDNAEKLVDSVRKAIGSYTY